MPTSAPTSPQLAVYAKLLCLLMVVICGAAAPMEEKVRLFNEKTKGFMEAARRGPFVSARNADVNLAKFTNLTIRSTSEFGVVELVFADLRPQRRLCMEQGKLKGIKNPRKWGRPGCLFRECIDGGYFFYLTKHAKPRLVGFNRGERGAEQFNPLGPRQCCSQERRFECQGGQGGQGGQGRAGCWEEREHLVPDPDPRRKGSYTCARRPARQDDVNYFFFLKKRRDNATLADSIPAHNHHKGGHNRAPAAADDVPQALRPDTSPSYRLRGVAGHVQAEQPRRSGRPHRSKGVITSTTTTSTTTMASTEAVLWPAPERPHRTRHHHRLQQLQQLPARTPRPVRVRHRKTQRAPAPRDDPGNYLPWD